MRSVNNYLSRTQFERNKAFIIRAKKKHFWVSYRNYEFRFYFLQKNHEHFFSQKNFCEELFRPEATKATASNYLVPTFVLMAGDLRCGMIYSDTPITIKKYGSPRLRGQAIHYFWTVLCARSGFDSDFNTIILCGM